MYPPPLLRVHPIHIKREAELTATSSNVAAAKTHSRKIINSWEVKGHRNTCLTRQEVKRHCLAKTRLESQEHKPSLRRCQKKRQLKTFKNKNHSTIEGTSFCRQCCTRAKGEDVEIQPKPLATNTTRPPAVHSNGDRNHRCGVYRHRPLNRMWSKKSHRKLLSDLKKIGLINSKLLTVKQTNKFVNWKYLFYSK